MQDNKRVVRGCRLYISTSITPFFFDQRKKLQKNLAKWKKWLHICGRMILINESVRS